MKKTSYYSLFKEFRKNNAKKYSNQRDTRILDNIGRWIEKHTIHDAGQIDEYVYESRGDKYRAVVLITEFYKYLQKATGEKIHTKLDYINVKDNPLFRRLEILKFLHEKHTVKEIAEYFALGRRTITGDLESLRNGITVMDSDISITEQKDPKHPKQIFYSSTVHPIILPLNLTEVFLLTVGMTEATKNSALAPAYRDIAQRIFSQLSPYGKEIINKSGKVNFIDGISKNSYRNEKDIILSENYDSFPYIAGYAVKSGSKVMVTFLHDGETKVEYAAIKFDYESENIHENFIICSETEQYRVASKDIISMYCRKEDYR